MKIKIDQTKQNAISAKILHRRSKWKYELLNNVILSLTIIVPLIFLIAQYVSKGTSYEETMNVISFVLSVVLIIISVIHMLLKVNDKIATHKMGIKNNLYIANECDNVLKLEDAELEWFFRYVTEIDNQDNDTFSNVSEKVRRKTYRDALKEFAPGNYEITCPICHSSPWEYKKGNCQLCGNTPKQKE